MALTGNLVHTDGALAHTTEVPSGHHWRSAGYSHPEGINVAGIKRLAEGGRHGS